MRKYQVMLLTLIALYFPVRAQELSNVNLGVINSGKNPEELFGALRVAKPDSNKVKLLVNLCGYHWSNGRNKDSIARYAEEARTLSQRLRYQPGFNEAYFIIGKNYLYNNEVNKAIKLLPDVPKDQQARILLAIGERYLFLPALDKHDLDTAFRYFSDALRMAKSIGAQAMKHHSLIALGKYYFANGQFNKAKDCFLEIIPDFQKTGDRAGEAHVWSELGKYMPDTDSTMKDELWAHGNALRIYHELKDTSNETSVLQDIAAVNMFHANFDTAKSQYSLALQLRKASGMKKLYRIYFFLGWINYATGNLNEALAMALESEKNRKLLKADDSTVNILLGLIYGDDGQEEKSLQYLLVHEDVDIHKKWRYFIYRKIGEQFIKLNQPQKALVFIRNAEKKNPALKPVDKQTLAAAKGDIYAAMNNPAQAEKYYLQMIQLDDEAQRSRSREIEPLLFPVSGSEAYYRIASFYESQKRYNMAGQYADRALQIHSFTGTHYYTAHLVQKIWWIKFKADSATGNYLAAIRNYEKYTAMNDSIFNAKKSNQLQQLQVQYETEKKETDIKTRDGQIQALTQNDLLRQANLKQAHFIRNISIVALGVVLVLGSLLYKQYRQKQKSAQVIAETNKVVSQKNLAITQKNEALEHLLVEKEWLLKEVHHRVKNNLHTVICLLESQAAYLESDAREANEVSQQRIYAMSLIHQKIYQSEDIKTIDMSVYLPELIQYLDDSFGNTDRIHFEMYIAPLQLDISQAVPLALIINETVTNAIKYAFPGNKRGIIEIRLQQDADEIMLSVADNGIGIDSTIINGVSDSLGLQLIRGLSKDLKARLHFENINGTRIIIVFNLNPINRNSYALSAMQGDELYA